jgi:2,3-diketo-5-methylthio-1-phosphopentane phosphatase
VNCHVFVDFDGTIVPQDATDRILDAFAPPSWLDIEAEWKAGRIGSRECLSKQVAMIDASPEKLDAVIATFEIDPGLPEFIDYCRAQGFGISIVSDGMDRAVKGVLDRHGIDLPFSANAMTQVGATSWKLGFPHMKQACVSQSGNCKCSAAMAAGAAATVMVGDGRSDFCISNRATFVLAKGALADHCAKNNLPHRRFDVFTEATRLLGHWVEETRATEAQADTEAARVRGRRMVKR